MKKKQLFILCMLLMRIYIPAALSQVILDKEHNLPGSHDLLTKVSLAEIDYSGKEIDLREKMINDTPVTVEYFAEAGSDDRHFSKIDEGTVWHYEYSDNKLSLLGYENQMVKVCFDMPPKLIHYPFYRHDSILSNFKGEGMYVDKIPLFYKGLRTVGNPAEHKLITPEGESIEHVYTLHAINRISLFPKTDAGDTDSLNMERESWETYARGYRYPVLETVLYRKNDCVPSYKAFYYPLDKQPYLDQDLANRNVRKQDEDEKDQSDPLGSDGTSPNIHCYMEGFHRAIAECRMEQECDITIILASVTGINYYTKKLHLSAHESQKVSFNCTGLPFGQYALYVNVGEKQYVSFFNIKL